MDASWCAGRAFVRRVRRAGVWRHPENASRGLSRTRADKAFCWNGIFLGTPRRLVVSSVPRHRASRAPHRTSERRRMSAATAGIVCPGEPLRFAEGVPRRSRDLRARPARRGGGRGHRSRSRGGGGRGRPSTRRGSGSSRRGRPRKRGRGARGRVAHPAGGRRGVRARHPRQPSAVQRGNRHRERPGGGGCLLRGDPRAGRARDGGGQGGHLRLLHAFRHRPRRGAVSGGHAKLLPEHRGERARGGAGEIPIHGGPWCPWRGTR